MSKSMMATTGVMLENLALGFSLVEISLFPPISTMEDQKNESRKFKDPAKYIITRL